MFFKVHDFSDGAVIVITRPERQEPSNATAHSSDVEQKLNNQILHSATPVTDQTKMCAVHYNGVTKSVEFLHRLLLREPVQLGEGESTVWQ